MLIAVGVIDKVPVLPDNGLTLVPSAGVASAERRVALIIGNSNYKNVQPLANPARDATAVGAMLKKAGFEVVESKLDLGNTAMRRTIREFTSTAKNADIAVVYYAGHGIEFDGTNYLIPVDAELASDVDVEDETISLDRIMRMLDPVKRLRLVILDACRENPFGKKMTRTIASRSMGRGLAKIEVTSTDTLVALVCRQGRDDRGRRYRGSQSLYGRLARQSFDTRPRRSHCLRASARRGHEINRQQAGALRLRLDRRIDCRAGSEGARETGAGCGGACAFGCRHAGARL